VITSLLYRATRALLSVPARIDRAPSFQVYQDRGVRVALAQREVVDPQDTHVDLR
jgi:hypothetical protein